jgi:hypothetical protein
MSENFWEEQLARPETWTGAPQWPNLEDDEDRVSEDDGTWDDMSSGNWAEENDWGEHEAHFGPQSGDDLE